MATRNLANKNVKIVITITITMLAIILNLVLSWTAAQCWHNTALLTCLVLSLTHLIPKVNFVTLILSLLLIKRRSWDHETICVFYVPCRENDTKFCHQWTPQRRIFHFPAVSDNNMAEARICMGGEKGAHLIFTFAPCINDKHFIIQLLHNI